MRAKAVQIHLLKQLPFLLNNLDNAIQCHCWTIIAGYLDMIADHSAVLNDPGLKCIIKAAQNSVEERCLVDTIESVRHMKTRFRQLLG